MMYLNPFHLSDRMLRQSVTHLSSEDLRRKLTSMADAMGEKAFKASVAREIVERSRPQQAIPDVYEHYRSLVRDGIEFFLSQVNCMRLMDLVVSQLTMDSDVGTEERLIELAKRFPTLHKLGQIIARHPCVDPDVKRWLVQLENGHYGTSVSDLAAIIDAQLEMSIDKGDIQVENTLLAEASVGAVLPFKWRPCSHANPRYGVCKILKPLIRGHLDEELAILEKTAAFFHRNRARYPLGNFRFLEIFEDVRKMMVSEVDLAAEQRHLKEAARSYENMPAICIPEAFRFSTDHMTAMEFLDGCKITDAQLTSEQRWYCASALFEALIVTPLFSRCDPALFHGDPHAGNILAVFDATKKVYRVGFLDWSLAGHLPLHDRVKTVRLIQGIKKKDLTDISNTVTALTMGVSHDNRISTPQIRKLVFQWMQTPKTGRQPLIKRAFQLLETLSFAGAVFPADLMLFRKAIFTLEGVIHDLCPGFDMDVAITRYLMELVQWEIPLRLGGLFFPLADRPENYPSLISNMDLQSLVARQYVDSVNTCTQNTIDLLMRWGRILGATIGTG